MPLSNLGPEYALAKDIKGLMMRVQRLETRTTPNSNFGSITSTKTYNQLLTGATRSLSIAATGLFGYVPSSRTFKQDEQPAVIDTAAVLALQLITYRYIAAVEEHGDNAATEIGLIAEDVHTAGLTWLVDYDTEGKPFGIRFDRIALALLPVIQQQEQRLTAIEQRLDAFINQTANDSKEQH
jgi:hypothetical protein